MHWPFVSKGHWRTELDSSKSNCIFLLFTVYSSHCLSMSTTSTKESKQTIIAERSRQNTEFVTNQPTPPQKKKKKRSHQCVIQIYRSDQIPRRAKAFVCAEIVLSNYLLVILMAKWITRHTGLCETFFGGKKTDGALYLV